MQNNNMRARPMSGKMEEHWAQSWVTKHGLWCFRLNTGVISDKSPSTILKMSTCRKEFQKVHFEYDGMESIKRLTIPKQSNF